MTAENDLRALWTEQGVSQDRQDELIAQITAKAQPGAMVGPFRIGYRSELTEAGEQLVIPGCEKDLAPGVRQGELF
jgi:hypothetical protein